MQYVCVSTHPVDLDGGRVVAPGERVELPSRLPAHAAGLVSDGHLAPVPAAKAKTDNGGAE